MICTKCNSELTKGVLVCNNCGQAVKANPATKNHTSEKLFSPVRRNYAWMILTLLYFAVLYVLINVYSRFFQYTSLRPSFWDAITSLNYLYYPFLFGLLVFPLLITVVIHKSYLKSLAAIAISCIPIYMYLQTLQNEAAFLLFIVLIVMLVVLIPVLSLSMLIRGFFRIKKAWLKFILATSPIVILIILFPLTYFYVQANITNKGIAYCDNLVGLEGGKGPNQKTNCYYQTAVKKNNPYTCLKIGQYKFRVPCLVEVFEKIDSNKLVIDVKYCNTLSSSDVDEKYSRSISSKENLLMQCMAALAVIKNDESLCDSNVPLDKIRFCHLQFNNYFKYYSGG